MSGVRLRIALFGAGRIGLVHADSIARLPRLELAVACSSSLGSAHRLAHRDGATATNDADAVFGGREVDAVVIASPDSTPLDLLTKAARSGLPALREKPLDLDLDRVRAARPRSWIHQAC